MPERVGSTALNETLATFPSGSSLRYTVTVTAPASGTFTNTATVGAPSGVTDPQLGNNSASVDTLVGTPAATADLAIVKTGTTVVPASGSVRYTLIVSNKGPSSVTQARVVDAVPADVGSVAWSCGHVLGGGVCNAPTSGSTHALDTTVNLPVGASVTFTVTGTAPASAAGFANLARVIPPVDITDPDGDNNVSGAVVTQTVTAPDVATRVVAPASVSVSVGSVVNVGVSYANLGPVGAEGVSYGLQLPAGLSSVTCAGATCAYDAGTGSVTVSGLPTALSAGSAVQITLSYRAPATSGSTVTVQSSVQTTTPGETPTSNNTASAATQTTGAAPAPDMTTTVTAPATAYAGTQVVAQVVFANVGAANASGVVFNLAGLPPGAVVRYSGLTCAWNSGTGALSGCGLPATMPIGQSLALEVVYTAPASGTVTLMLTTGADADGNPSNNTASASTVIATAPATPLADVTAAVTAPARANPGSTVLVRLTFGNAGPATASSVGYAVALSGGASAAQFSRGGVACGYAAGAVSGCGLPASLLPGQTVDVQLSFKAPSPTTGTATVTVVATASTSTPEVSTLNNTAAGSVQVDAITPSGSISGRVWYDLNRNRVLDAGESGRAGWQVELLQGSVVLAQTVTGSDGAYRFTGLADGVYSVRFLQRPGAGALPVNGESGVAVPGGGVPGYSILSNIVISGATTASLSGTRAMAVRALAATDTVSEQSLPVDPSGVVYDSVTRQPLAGATVTLGSSCGPVQPGWIGGGSASVTTGGDGSYAFFFDPSAPACTYTLSVSKSGYIFPSVTLAPASGAWPASGGLVAPVAGAPAQGQSTTYYLSGPVPSADLLNNNLPLDPVVVPPVPTPAPTPIPTLNAWALMALAAWLAWMTLRQQRRRVGRAD